MFKTNYNLSLVRYLLTLSLGLFMLIISPVTIAAVHKSAQKIASPAKIAPPAKTLIKPLDKIIAIINDEIITSTQWQQAIVAAKQQLQASNTALPADSVLSKQVLDQLIVKSLQMQIVKKSGIKITATQVNAGLNSMAEKNNISLDQLRSKIEGSGMSFRHYREQMKQQMAIMQLQSMAISKQISITPQEVDTAMLQLSLSSPLKYHYGDILISLPETPTSQQVKTAFAKAKKVVKQLRRPRADFKKIAAANSASAQAFNGGDMGWSTLTDMPELFVPAVKKLRVGEVSDPLRAGNGFHVLKLFSTKRSKGNLARNQVEQQLRQRKFQENLSLWLQQLRDSAYIKIMVPGYKSLESAEQSS